MKLYLGDEEVEVDYDFDEYGRPFVTFCEVEITDEQENDLNLQLDNRMDELLEIEHDKKRGDRE